MSCSYGFDVIIWNPTGRACAENLCDIIVLKIENEEINKNKNDKPKKYKTSQIINTIFFQKELLPLLISSFGVGFFITKIITAIITLKTNELLYNVIITFVILLLETITVFLYSNRKEHPFNKSLKHYFSILFIFSNINIILIMLIYMIYNIIFLNLLYIFAEFITIFICIYFNFKLYKYLKEQFIIYFFLIKCLYFKTFQL